MRWFWVVFLLAAFLRAAPSSAAAPFIVQDEDGRVLLRGRTVWLAPGRAGLPVEAYERLGLSVQRDLARGTADIFMRESDYGKGFRAGSRQVLDYPQPVPRSYPHRMALQRHGRLYVSARLMHDALPERFSMTVDARTHAIRLRRSPSFARMLKAWARETPSAP